MSASKEAVSSRVEEASAGHPSHGLVQRGKDVKPDTLDSLSFDILDDSLYNALHDILMPVYREEKIARCNTAAIFLEKKAADEVDATYEPLNVAAGKANIRTKLAYFDSDGLSSLDHGARQAFQDEELDPEDETPADWDGIDVPNVMEEVNQIYCRKCRLPEFPYPTEGEGSRRPEPGVEYCTKRVYVDNPPADIYNQNYQADIKGVGKGNGNKKKKNDLIKELTPNGSQDSPNTSPSANGVVNKQIPYPTVKCPMQPCSRSFPIQRVSAHLARDHGNGRRAANRDALERIQNNGYGSSHSRNATPTPTNGSKGRSSPNKRDADEFDSEESPQKKVKINTKKIKAPSMVKTHSQMSSSNLNHVETQLSDDDYADDGDYNDGDFGSNSKDPKKKKVVVSKPIKPVAKKKPMKNGDASWPDKKNGKKATINTTITKPSPGFPPETKSKIKLEFNLNGKNKTNPQNGPREKSDSSQTLSSPNA